MMVRPESVKVLTLQENLDRYITKIDEELMAIWIEGEVRSVTVLIHRYNPKLMLRLRNTYRRVGWDVWYAGYGVLRFRCPQKSKSFWSWLWSN